MKMLEGLFKMNFQSLKKQKHSIWYTVPTYNKKDEISLLPVLFLKASLWLVLLFDCRFIMRPILILSPQSSRGKLVLVSERTEE